MGQLKSKRSSTKEYALNSFELNYLKALAINRNSAYNQYQTAIQTFLSYVAGTKWGYKENQLLEFEFDAEKELVKVKVKDETIDKP